ncbi:HET-domain-containing protein [Pseudovirgaria hyperparasitica]|uniref:HET-domain-containing protein n=1 Tax=Pseudovirgaria hyperparasitica TaxID=470096 RepID=A0A6A6VUJ9_9PEZI|nr:HET-domain-containing protein [Pseudovirgaria hyperparasitica]KAF2753835.1 HET-domain-containing protein [Pseudovirgaria hyperparasitica]
MMKLQRLQKYTYEPALLDGHIRLLKVRNASNEDVLELDLVQQHLSEATYEALSYAWGDTSDKEQVLCNGLVLDIGRNLHAALCERRRRDVTTWLWADAICINQTDDDEKTRQVRVMREIYAGAKKVIIWLGTGSLSDAAAYVLAEHLFYKCRVSTKTTKRHGYAYEDFDFRLHGVVPPFGSARGNSAWIALFHIMRSPWFSRIWVLQELFVAKESTMWKGTLEFDPEIILWTASLIGLHRNLANAFNTLLGCPETSQLYAQNISLSFGRFKSKGPLPIYEMLSHHADMQATDPRDRFFALVGISSGLDPCFIDYDIPLSEIASLVGKMAMLGMPGYQFSESLNGLEWLHFSGDADDHRFQLEWLSAISNPNGRTYGVPSWLPDFITVPKMGAPIQYLYRTRFTGNAKFEHGPHLRLRFPSGETVDCIGAIHYSTRFKMQIPENVDFRGCIFDTIRTIARPRPRDSSTSYFTGVYTGETPFDIFRTHHEVAKFQASLLEWLTEIRLLADPSLSPTSHFDAGDSFDAFWRTLIYNRGPRYSSKPNDKPVSPEVATIFLWWTMLRKWMVKTQNTRSLRDIAVYKMLSDLSRPFEVIENVMRDARNFFVSRHGRIGWVPFRAQQGDSICIFKGCRTPFVLGARNEGWEIIGAAYVHGCMDGEMWSLGDEEWEWMSFV